MAVDQAALGHKFNVNQVSCRENDQLISLRRPKPDVGHGEVDPVEQLRNHHHHSGAGRDHLHALWLHALLGLSNRREKLLPGGQRQHARAHDAADEARVEGRERNLVRLARCFPQRGVWRVHEALEQEFYEHDS